MALLVVFVKRGADSEARTVEGRRVGIADGEAVGVEGGTAGDRDDVGCRSERRCVADPDDPLIDRDAAGERVHAREQQRAVAGLDDRGRRRSVVADDAGQRQGAELAGDGDRRADRGAEGDRAISEVEVMGRAGAAVKCEVGVDVDRVGACQRDGGAAGVVQSAAVDDQGRGDAAERPRRPPCRRR